MAEYVTLEPVQLYRHCDASRYTLNSLAEMPQVPSLLLQPRAGESLLFGLDISRRGFNIFVMGTPGVGRHSAVKESLRDKAKSQAAAPDLCIVENFTDPYSPDWVLLPAGRGTAFASAMRSWLEDVAIAVPAVFTSEGYELQVRGMESEWSRREVAALRGLEQSARQSNIGLQQSVNGLRFLPMREDKVLEPEQFMQLPAGERALMQEALDSYQERLEKLVAEFTGWRHEGHEQSKQLEHELVLKALAPIMRRYRDDWSGVSSVLAYLGRVEADLLAHIPQLRRELAQVENIRDWLDSPDSLAARYKVNPFVCRSGNNGAPVEYCGHPSDATLFGWGEQRIHQGALAGDYQLLRAGVVHRASGGYLVVDAEKLLSDISLWDDLKQVLSTGKLRRERGRSSRDGLQVVPQTLPVKLRLVLIGERSTYYQLVEQDPEFLRLFKVVADFEDRMNWDEANEKCFVQMLASMCREENLLCLSADSAARMVEHGARLVDDAERLTTNLGMLADTLREADYWARHQDHDAIHVLDVERAIHEQERRVGRVRERFQEDILRGNVIINTDGMVPAQVNGLTVIEAGDYAFGLPSRITATAWLGEGEIIDIEREVELGGALHSKGVLILSQFLGARYVRTHSLSVTASLVFEQSYGPLEGDSASLGELCALLSALADIPVAQHLAVTGSVNQLGEIQAIGGVNEKIEGFFEICRARELTGKQGVILPRANIVNLMLHRDIVAAVADGKFNLYAVDHVDQAMQLLTGMAAGEVDSAGQFPAGTVNARVSERLAMFAKLRQQEDKDKPDDTADHDH